MIYGYRSKAHKGKVWSIHIFLASRLVSLERLQEFLQEICICIWVVQTHIEDDMYGLIRTLYSLRDHVHRFNGGIGTIIIELYRNSRQVGSNRLFFVLGSTVSRNIIRSQLWGGVKQLVLSLLHIHLKKRW